MEQLQAVLRPNDIVAFSYKAGFVEYSTHSPDKKACVFAETAAARAPSIKNDSKPLIGVHFVGGGRHRLAP